MRGPQRTRTARSIWQTGLTPVRDHAGGLKAGGYVLALVAFVVVATANAGTYRFGVSDQAFYIPVVARALDPGAFPRDATLIDAQGQLMLADEAIAALVRSTGLSLDTLFFGAYLVSLACIFAGLALIGRRLYASSWTTMALIAAFSLRHQITRTSANSFEPYFHPRMLAFGVGLLAVGAFLHRRHVGAVALVFVATAVHGTTGLWFAILLGVALVVVEPVWRRAALPLGVIAGAGAVWALVLGPLRPRLVVMDDLWLQAVAAKDSLFATAWPLSAWAANLGLLGVLWVAYRARRASGDATDEERGLVWGTTALVGIFVVTLPAIAARIAFPVQLQISRVFWLVDVTATVLAIGALARMRWVEGTGRTALAAALVAIAVARGVYIVAIEHPERSLFTLHLVPSPWTDAMRWLASQPLDAHVLADSGHAWRYGSSVRVAAGRDVLLEETKDAAVAIYSRDVAVRVVERIRALGDLSRLGTPEVEALGERYGLTHVVTEGRLDLPLLYENSRFRIYALAPPTRHAAGDKLTSPRALRTD